MPEPNSERAAQVLSLPDGSRVGIADYGAPDGAPVLALHGAPASRLMFSVADVAACAANFRIIAPDRPGYGLTDVDRNPTLDRRAEWLEKVADALGLDRFAILAISGGGPYATALASRLGNRVTALALVSPMGPIADVMATTPANRPAVPFLQRRFFLHLPRRWIFPPLARLAARIFMASPRGFVGGFPRLIGDPDAHILRKPHIREAMLAMTREALRDGAEGGIADLRIYGAPWNIDIARITAPAMLWQGTADRIVPVAAALHLARLIPGCRLMRLEGAGHFWVFDHMTEVFAGLRAMTEISSSAGAAIRPALGSVDTTSPTRT